MSEQNEQVDRPVMANPAKKSLATFRSEEGPSVAVMPDLSLEFSEGWTPDAAARQILEHALPRMVVLLQLQQGVDQAITLDMLGKLKLVTCSTPAEVGEVLNFKNRLLQLNSQFVALHQRDQQ